MCSPAFSTRGDGFRTLTSPLLLYLLNHPAEWDRPNSWSIAPQVVVNVQEPACVSPQSKASVAMEEIFCMICYYKAYIGKKKKEKKGQTDRNEEVVQCLLGLFFVPFFVCLFCDAVTVRNCLETKINSIVIKKEKHQKTWQESPIPFELQGQEKTKAQSLTVTEIC